MSKSTYIWFRILPSIAWEISHIFYTRESASMCCGVKREIEGKKFEFFHLHFPFSISGQKIPLEIESKKKERDTHATESCPTVLPFVYYLWIFWYPQTKVLFDVIIHLKCKKEWALKATLYVDSIESIWDGRWTRNNIMLWDFLAILLFL